jgi:ABC-type sugar transport system substrate-binding protein
MKRACCLMAALFWMAPLAAELDGSVPAHVQHRRLAWLANDPTNTYDNATYAGMTDIAGALGYAVEAFYAGFDLSTQLAQCHQALRSNRYDGLLIDADDAVGIEPCVAEADQAAVPVVAIDLAIGPNPATVRPQVAGEVGASFIPASRWAKAVKTILPQACQGLNPCNVLYLAGDEALAFDQLGFQAVRSAVAANPTLRLVGEDQAFYDTATAKRVMIHQLTVHPAINLVVAAGDQMALGVEQAATELGPKVRIIGAGAGASAISAVRQGRWFATFNALPRTEGQLAAAIMELHLVDRELPPVGVDPIAFSALPDMWTRTTLAQHPNFVPQWPGP